MELRPGRCHTVSSMSSLSVSMSPVLNAPYARCMIATFSSGPMLLSFSWVSEQELQLLTGRRCSETPPPRRPCRSDRASDPSGSAMSLDALLCLSPRAQTPEALSPCGTPLHGRIDLPRRLTDVTTLVLLHAQGGFVFGPYAPL